MSLPLPELKFFKRIDDLLFLEDLFDQAYSVNIVPHENVAYALMRPGFRIRGENRLLEVKRFNNGLVWAKFKLTL